MNRPMGVTIIAILSFLSGLGHCLKGLLVLGIGGGVAAVIGVGHPAAGVVIGTLAVSVAVLAVMIGVFDFLFAWGAWTLKPWAWSWGYFTQISSLIWALLAVLGWGTFRTQAVPLAISLGILLYLTSPGIKRAFGRS
jgi:uncharacterized membrane protein (DUF2068 family)